MRAAVMHACRIGEERVLSTVVRQRRLGALGSAGVISAAVSVR